MFRSAELHRARRRSDSERRAEEQRDVLSAGAERDDVSHSIFQEIGIQTLSPVTIDHVEKHGVVCCFKRPAETAELTKILASAAPPGIPDHEFGDAVRVIVKVNDDTGENLVAIVEDTFNEGSGVVRRDGMARPMSGSAMADLKRLVETRCKWPDDDLQQSSSPAQGRR